MRGRRAVLLAILVYVTLDLSVPTIPGAFVFAPEDSVESTQGHRGRSVAEVVLAPALAVDSSTLSLPRIGVGDRRVSTSPIAPPIRRVVKRLPRATLTSAPPSEDTHEPLLRLL
jgi:hypothetical protein